MKYEHCQGCGDGVGVEDDYEPEYCCAGASNECGCYGRPINPVFCGECEEKLFDRKRIKTV